MALGSCPVCTGATPDARQSLSPEYLGRSAGELGVELLGFARTTTADPWLAPESPLQVAPFGYFSFGEELANGTWRVVDYIACRLTGDGLTLEAHVWADHPLHVTMSGWQVPTVPPGTVGTVGPPLAEAKRLLVAFAALQAHAGRPRGSGFYPTREAFLAVFGPPVRELRKRYRRDPRPSEVLRHLRTKLGDILASRFTEWRQRLGWPRWEDFLRDVKDELETDFP